ncbi:MAG: HAD family phosphatase [Eggerthellaceae bacterium]|nr:HAD family phosphatase [Eggerthellaceae bacterium]
MTGIIFDCDGVLLDSVGSWWEMEHELARIAGVVLTQEERDAIVTFTIGESGAYFHEKHGLGESPEDVVRMMDEFMLAYYRAARPREGALEFVRAMRERGVRMSVASSSPQKYLQAGLEAVGLLPYLDAVVSVDDVGASKRQPDVYHAARAAMGTALEDTWGFEDSLYAVRTLAAAGYRTVGLYERDGSGTFDDLQREATVAVRSFAELDLGLFCK